MAIIIDIPTYLSAAALSEYLAAADIKQKKELSDDLALYIKCVRKGITAQYNINSTDVTLNDTCQYLRAICGEYFSIVTNALNPACVPVQITLNPVSGSFLPGNSFSLTGGASGTATINYQWYKDGVAIPGAINNSYMGTSAGNYYFIATNGCGTATSTIAVMAQSTGVTVEWWWGDTDPYPALSGGTDALTYLGSFILIPGSNITVTWPLASIDNKYRVVKYPGTESSKTHWLNNGSNQGSIPGSAYNEIVTIGLNKYIISKGDSIDGVNPVIYS